MNNFNDFINMINDIDSAINHLNLNKRLTKESLKEISNLITSAINDLESDHKYFKIKLLIVTPIIKQLKDLLLNIKLTGHLKFSEIKRYKNYMSCYIKDNSICHTIKLFKKCPVCGTNNCSNFELSYNFINCNVYSSEPDDINCSKCGDDIILHFDNEYKEKIKSIKEK